MERTITRIQKVSRKTCFWGDHTIQHQQAVRLFETQRGNRLWCCLRHLAPLNHPAVDVVIVEHTTSYGDPTHVEVGAAYQPTLRRIDYGDPVRLPDRGVLRYGDAKAEAIEQYLREKTLSYALFQSHINGWPVREWGLDADGEYRLYLRQRRDSILHAENNGQPACGTTYDKPLRRLLPETVEHVEQHGGQLNRCQHPACQQYFGD